MTKSPDPDAGFVEQLKSYESRARTVELQNTERNLSVSDQIALLEANIRRNLAYAIMILFALVNIITLLFVLLLFRADQSDLAEKMIGPADRVVNAHVLMALLAATTVQLGTVMVIMTRFIFKAPVDASAADGEED